MIYDFAEIEKYIPAKVTPNFGVLEDTGVRWPNVTKYAFRGHTDLDVLWNEKTRFLRIRGSLAFAFQNHNTHFTQNDFQSSIRFLQNCIGVALFDAHVNEFEAGVLLEVPFNPEAFFNAHLQIKGMKTIPKDYGRYFEDSITLVKMYDAGRRIKQVVPQSVRNTLQTDYGYKSDAHYVRIENHYKKPAIRFKQTPFWVADLLTPDFGERCKLDLLTTYESIMQSAYQLPTDKKDLSASNIYLLALKQAEGRFGFNAEEVILSLLKTIPEGVLTKEDRKKRRAKIREDFKKLTSADSGKSAFDVSGLLREKLEL